VAAEKQPTKIHFVLQLDVGTEQTFGEEQHGQPKEKYVKSKKVALH
jgi:hypothetical protein